MGIVITETITACVSCKPSLRKPRQRRPELSQELHGLPYRIQGGGPGLYSWDLGRDRELLGFVSVSSASRAAKASIISSALVLIVASRKRAAANVLLEDRNGKDPKKRGSKRLQKRTEEIVPRSS